MSARIGALLLAAGQARRMGRNKLVQPFRGMPLIRHSALALIRAELDPIIVVTGPEAEPIETALGGLPLCFVHNPRSEEGLSRSLICGLDALGAADAGLIALGDMPLVRPETIRDLGAAYDRAGGRLICVPVHEGIQGNPVLWGLDFFGELRTLSGDKGAKALRARHGDKVALLETSDPGVLIDIDTPEDLVRLEAAP
jgi:molybdenum cofactor cytidylyltransferase